MKKISLFLFFILFLTKINAQQFGYQFSDNFAFNSKGVNIFYENKNIRKNENNFYLYEQAFPGNIKLYSKEELISGFMIKYDILNNLLEIKKEDTTYYILGREVLFFKIHINGKTKSYINTSVLKNGNLSSYFLEILEYGEINLMKQTTLLLQEPMGHRYGANVQTSKYKKKESFFFQQNNRIIPLQRKKKTILKTLENKNDEINRYVKNNKLSFRKEKDFILFKKSGFFRL